MSGLIVGLVMRLPVTPEFNKDVKFVAMIYAEHAWPDGSHSHPAVETVARYIGCSDRSVQRHVKVLVDMGLLIPDGKGPKGTNQYRFMLHEMPDGSTKLQLVSPKTAPVFMGDTVSPRQIVTPEAEGGDTDSGDTDSSDTSVTRLNNPLLSTSSAIGADAQKKFDPEPEPQKANIFRLYEENIGPLTPLLAARLKDAEKDYLPTWIEYAVSEAVTHNKRSWDYIDAILRRIKTEGFENDHKLFAAKAKTTNRSRRTPTGDQSSAGSGGENPARRAAIEKINQRRRGAENRGADASRTSG